MEAENAIATEELEISNVRSSANKLKEISKLQFEEMNQKNEIILRSEAEITKRVRIIERKQDLVDQLNKKLETMIQSAGV